MASSPLSSCVCEQATSNCAVNTQCYRDVTYTYREYFAYNCYVTGPLTLGFIKRHVPCMRRALRRRLRRNAVPYALPNPMVPGKQATQTFPGEQEGSSPLLLVPEKDAAQVERKPIALAEEPKVEKKIRLSTHGKVMAGGLMGDAQSGGTYLPRADQLKRACSYLSDLKFFFSAIGKTQKEVTALTSEAARTLYDEAVEDMRDDVIVSGAVEDDEPKFPTPVTDEVEFPGIAAHEQYAEDMRLWGFPKRGIPPKLDATIQKYVDFRVRCGPGGTTVFDPKANELKANESKVSDPKLKSKAVRK